MSRDKQQFHVGKKFYKASRKCWHCMIDHPDGRRQERRLDPDEETAEGIRQKLLEEIKKHGVPSLECSVDHLVQSFLSYVEDNNAPATYKWYAHFLLAWKNSPGIATLRVGELRLHHFQNWLKKAYPVTTNQNTRHDAIACLKRLFNWAVNDMEYLTHNPLAKLRKPQRTHRDACPTREQWEEVLTHYDAADPFTDFLTVLIDTGCRPQEMRIVGARHLDLAAQPSPLIRFADGDIPGKPWGRDVKLTDRDVDILKRLALKCPEGPLFRNQDGRPWTKSALNCRFQRLKKAKLPFKVNCYAARHSLATDILDNGGSAGAVASLLGHRDPTVVLKFYGKHIDQRPEHLQGLLDKARKPSPSGKKDGVLPITEEDARKAADGTKKDAG